MYTAEQLKELYHRLAAPFPKEAIERTRASETKRGYDTTGLKYQYIADRLNEVLGVGGFRVSREFTVREKTTRSGLLMFEATCDVVMQLGHWDGGQFVPFAEATGTGGHVATTDADARKGSFTNAFKKTAAFFGVGRQAYAGALDDDNVPAPAESRRPAAGNASVSGGRNDDRERQAVNGRVTAAQLARLRELVGKAGGEWTRYREHVRQQRGTNVEYVDRRVAGELINALTASVQARNGGAQRQASVA